MKTITLNLYRKVNLLFKRYLLFFGLILFGLTNANSQCIIDTAATGGDNIMSGAELLDYINDNNCSGTLTIEAPVDIILSSDTVIPNSIDRLVIKDGAQILWSTNNVGLYLAENSAIVIENTTDTGPTTGALGSTSPSCGNTRAVYIGSVKYSACAGGGNVCIIFAEVIEAGGTIQLDPDFGVISGTDNEVCFAPTLIDLQINGFVEGSPSYVWTTINKPSGANVTFDPSNTVEDPTVTVSQPGVYEFMIEVTVPLSTDCLDQTVTVNTTIEIEFVDTISIDLMSITPGSGGSCNLVVDFTGTTMNAGPNSSYLWEFGDGNTSTDLNPTHTYAQNGEYIVTLTVTDPEAIPDCNTVIASETINLTDNSPTITGNLTPSSIIGCTIADAPNAFTTVAELEALGLQISDETSDLDLIVSHSDNPQNSCPITITRTYTITDDCSNSNTIDHIITINIPDFTLPADGASTVNCLVDAQVQPTPPSVNDACGNAITPVLKTTPNNIACDGDMIWVFTYTDCEGNSHDWSYTYTIDIPDFTLPADGASTVNCLVDAQVQPTPPSVN
ncbi:PKD domain-containing protein, partial [Gaetbulibacter saemankumensis]|uniref:PKD domain-containing protein n=1 Tax=Gaetbulibacter saemankumensis TaxID=311208 RepID=UPI0005549F12